MAPTGVYIASLASDTMSPPKESKKSGSDDKASTTAATTELLSFSTDGDIILLVGPSPTCKLKVAASTLCAASPVFRAMLTGHFAEGQVSRTSEEPQEIRLPDDDERAVIDMLGLIHHQVLDFDGKACSGHRWFRLVCVTDKYICTDMLRLQHEALLAKRTSPTLGRS